MVNRVLIFDMESNLTNKIAQSVDAFNLTYDVVHWEKAKKVTLSDYKSIIVSGSSKIIRSNYPTIYEPSAPTLPESVQKSNIPLLGICYGMQWLAKSNEGSVSLGEEDGLMEFTHNGTSFLFQGVPQKFNVHMKHKWMVTEEPCGWKITGNTNRCPIASMEKGNKFAVQFHPEHKKCQHGKKIIKNFLKKI